MEIEKLFGLPAHPLLVHAAVVLLPLAAILVVVVACVPRTRKVGAPLALGFAMLATVSVGLAQGSGEELEENVKETELVEAHTDAGESVLPWAVGVTVVAAVATAAGPLQSRGKVPSPRVVTAALTAAALAAGVGATYTVVDVGHSGAKAVWSDTSKTTPTSGGDSDAGERDDD